MKLTIAVLNEIPQQLLNGLSGSLVCTFMSPSRLILVMLVILQGAQFEAISIDHM